MRIDLICLAGLVTCCLATVGDAAGERTIVVRRGTTMAAAVSPDGSRIAFDLHGTLWLMPVAGGRATRLTDEVGDARQPSWSPDGRRIAFQSYRDGTWRIWIANADGTGARAVTSGPFDDREPHWSPDGVRIAFSSDRSGSYDVWVLDVGSGAISQVTRTPANEYRPAWSPNGAEIAFVSTRTPDPGIYAITLDGRERLLAAGAGTLGAPAWTPDGSTVVWSEVSGGNGRLLRGNDALSVGEDVSPFRPQWLPSGHLVYTADGLIKRRRLDDPTPVAIEFETELTVRPAEYTPRRRDFDAVSDRPALGIVRPALSPRGDRIAFCALGDVWVGPVGESPARVTDDRFAEADVTWAPDGSAIIFSSDRNGSFDLWLHTFATGRDERLTTERGEELAAAWSPQGDRVAFIEKTGYEQGELFVIDLATRTPRRLLERSFGPGFPSWSADGQTLIVSSLNPYSTRYREGVNQILAVPTGGGAARRIVPVEHRSAGKRAGDGPAWSPDGRHLAYVMEGRLHVQPVDPSGEPAGTPRRLSDELADQVSWAGDSKHVLFTATDRLKLVSIDDLSMRDVSPPLRWQQAVTRDATVVHAGRLVDGISPTARVDVDIVIDGHRISQIAPHRESLHRGRVVDASDATVMPGLIEGHGHWGREYGARFAATHLAYGITAVRSPGAPPYPAIEEREAIASGRRHGPRLFTTGYLLDGVRPYYPMSSGAADEATVDLEIERARRLEYDLLKTYVRLPDVLQRRAIEGAHRIGIPVSSHEVYPAASFGIDSVEHQAATSRRGYSPKFSVGGKVYDDVLTIVSAAGMTFTPTAALGRFRPVFDSTPELKNDVRWQRLFPSWARATFEQPATTPVLDPQRTRDWIAAYHRAGVRILAGTDSPLVPYAVALHVELGEYVASGMTPFQALQTATMNVARALHVERDLGSIEVGKLADLVVVEGDPLADITAARRVRVVIADGRVHSIADILDDRTSSPAGRE